jgi:hypothetical protein
MQNWKANVGKLFAIIGPLLALVGFLGKIILDAGEQRAQLNRAINDIAHCATKENLNTFKDAVTTRFTQSDVVDIHLREGLTEITTVVKVYNHLGEYSTAARAAAARPRGRLGGSARTTAAAPPPPPPAEVAQDALEQHEAVMQKASREEMKDPLEAVAF